MWPFRRKDRSHATIDVSRITGISGPPPSAPPPMLYVSPDFRTRTYTTPPTAPTETGDLPDERVMLIITEAISAFLTGSPTIEQTTLAIYIRELCGHEALVKLVQGVEAHLLDHTLSHAELLDEALALDLGYPDEHETEPSDGGAPFSLDFDDDDEPAVPPPAAPAPPLLTPLPPRRTGAQKFCSWFAGDGWR